MYTVVIIAEGQQQVDETGKIVPCPPGTVIMDTDAWRLCLRGFRNAPPIAEPGDEETAKKVRDEIAAREPRRAAQLAMLQNRINNFAKDGKRFRIDAASGKFLRINGELAGNLMNVERHIIETAESYGLVPVVEPAAGTAPEPTATVGGAVSQPKTPFPTVTEVNNV